MIDKNTLETTTLKYKVLVLSPTIPPYPSGQANILGRLFKDWPAGSHSFISSKKDHSNGINDSNLIAKSRSYQMEIFPISKKNKIGAILSFPYIFLHFIKRVTFVLNILKKDKLNAVMACSGGIFDLPVGYIASRLAKVPFYAYLFDDYVYQWPSRLPRLFARAAEYLFIKKAKKVIVPNEYLAEEYHKRHGINVEVLYNPVDDKAFLNRNTTLPWSTESNATRIVYTGSIYHAHYDAFQNLVVTLKELNRDIELHLFTPHSRESLEEKGISGPVVYHTYCDSEQIKGIQHNADILFLPLAFSSSIPEVIKTSAPGKMGEYLASGRPILAYVPKDCFVSWYFKKNDCGVVVEQNDLVLLKQSIISILDNRNRAEQIAKNAEIASRNDFSLDKIQGAFQNLFRMV